MKRILAAILFGLMSLAGAQAQTSIQNLPAAQAISPADLMIVDQLIAPSVRRTAQTPISAVGPAFSATIIATILSTPNTWAALQGFSAGIAVGTYAGVNAPPSGGTITSGAVGINTTNPGSTQVASGFACPATGAGNGCFDVGGVLVLNAQQQAYDAYGAFASTAYFASTGASSVGWAWGLNGSGGLTAIYTTHSFTSSNTTPVTWTPTWQYYQGASASSTNPAFGFGLALGFNQQGAGETDFVANRQSLGTTDFAWFDWNDSTLTQLMSINSSKQMLVGSSYPNPANIGGLNINAGSNNVIEAMGGSAKCTTTPSACLSAYYANTSGSVMFWQSTDNTNGGLTTVGTTLGIDMRATNSGSNSFAGIIGQITAISAGAVTGTLNLLVANNSTFGNVNALALSGTLATFGVPIEVPAQTFSTLPSAAAGMVAYITDALAANCGDTSCTTWGTTVTGGGGALKRSLWYNGTNWTLIGK